MTTSPDGAAVVVTGATSGIGWATASRLHADGARVLVTGRDEERGRRLVESLGARACFVAADLAAPGSADAVTDACLQAFGRLDALVNAAAVDHTGDLLSTPMADIRRVFEVNTFGAIAMIQAAARVMEHGGSIVNITSRLALVGVPTMGIYAASKGAVQALTLSAAVELAPRGIRVNDVAPGMTRTPLYDAWLARTPEPAATEREVLSRIPLGRLAVPDDVAAAVRYLVSDEARHVTGTVIRVDGGYTAQ
ncbi:SDR family NAD(P)-dependent oxidoreductase [Mycolicibacterium chlorophenolicum]|uniref:Cyclopentanol dehydrogenase n=1 Tax=Mycolicibacterium chlorophenolicum TaxID=37916 RepID=A0A0J6VHB1_9MYCO|nr:SDR family oxidoreductase [Mycolicibacterium chlorophenolicum]KMO70400.1 Cyclopentanol dehydrogenase [Mycolicibacterium chlorophenolicum]